MNGVYSLEWFTYYRDITLDRSLRLRWNNPFNRQFYAIGQIRHITGFQKLHDPLSKLFGRSHSLVNRSVGSPLHRDKFAISEVGNQLKRILIGRREVPGAVNNDRRYFRFEVGKASDGREPAIFPSLR